MYYLYVYLDCAYVTFIGHT